MGTHMKVISESYPMSTNMTGFLDGFPKLFHYCPSGQSSLSIGRVRYKWEYKGREYVIYGVFPWYLSVAVSLAECVDAGKQSRSMAFGSLRCRSKKARIFSPSPC